MKKLSTLLFLAALALVGCTAPTDQAPSVSASDSAAECTQGAEPANCKPGVGDEK